MKKLTIYVHSFEIPTIGFIDKESAVHACAHAQKVAFQGLEQVSGILGNRYLSDEEIKAITVLENFCKNWGVEFELTDLATVGFLTKLKMRLRGSKTPAVYCGKKIFYGVPSEEQLAQLLL